MQTRNENQCRDTSPTQSNAGHEINAERNIVATLKNKNVLITGGSAGFGWQLALAFGAAGAKPILVARDKGRLQEAATNLYARRIDSFTFAADVTKQDDVDALTKFIREDVQQVDVLINNAGKSDRGRIVETSVETFQQLWELNFLSAVRCTQAVLPQLIANKGSIVNVGSLACKTSGQYLGAYPATKFPLAAYSQQLRLELAEQDVHVMLVCPGPMQRDDAGQRYAERTADLPASAQRPGGSKLKGLCPAKLANQVVRGCERRQLELIVPRKARWLFAVSQLWPKLGDRILKRMT